LRRRKWSSKTIQFWAHASSLACNKGPHCWRDRIRKKYYKLNTHYLKSLIMYVQDGYTLKTHDGVPENIREELYADWTALGNAPRDTIGRLPGQ
jgi:hypothetical protein